MRLQKSTRFAIYSVLEFAAAPDRPTAASEVAERYGISPHHLAKVLRVLGRAGVVEAVRGVGGGYRFAGNAKRLTLMDVIELFEDIGSDASEEGGADSGRSPNVEPARALARVVSEIDEIAKATFRSITIATMLKLIERERGAAFGAEPADGRRHAPAEQPTDASSVER
jgi:Rrf2 family protein